MRTLLVSLLAAAALAAGCGKAKERKPVDATRLLGEAPMDPDPQRGGTFTWGRGADSAKLDPADVDDGESVKVITNLFDTLVTFEPGTTEIMPWLATRWETDSARLVWTFDLREDVKFHDGTPFNAAAVVFSFMRQKDPKHPARRPDSKFAYYQNNFKKLEKIEAVDEFQVRFTLSEPYAPFLAALALFSCSIVSPAAFEREGVDFARNPVGTGPFVFDTWESDVRIVLKANEDYWAKRPWLDTLIFKPVENPHARLKELQAGGITGMDNPALEDLASIEKDERARLLSRPGINVCYLAMNTLKKPFDDVRVRQAVAWTIDKERLIEAAYDGNAEPAVTMCPKNMIGFNDRIIDRRPNLKKARELLAAAGYEDGFEVTLFYMANQRAYIPNPAGTAIQIEQDLKQVGIRVKKQKIDWAAYLPRVQNGEHDMCILGWMADIFDPDNFLYVLLDKENAVKGKANNVSFYQSERVHKLLLEAQRTTEWRHRERLYHEVQEIAFEECPTIPLATVPDFRVVRGNVRGYTIYPAGGEYFRHVSFASK